MSSILLVEDSPTQAMHMKMLLEAGAHQVTTCDDGTAALELLSNSTNEIVVTDLELPMMNGLDLIKKMQIDFPDIPAVLVTGYGSERLAAEALRIGATGYVPKSLIDEMLLGTVQDVLGILRTDRNYGELIDCTTENRMIFDLPNKPRLLTTAIDLTMQMAAGMQLLSGVESYRVGTALRHAASNAIYRGNLELKPAQWQQASSEDDEEEKPNPIVTQRLESAPYNERKIHFDARLLQDLIRIVIRDDGPGFDTSIFGKEEDADAIKDGHGRGLLLIKNFMDKVSFNDAGNEITMVKHCTGSGRDN